MKHKPLTLMDKDTDKTGGETPHKARADTPGTLRRREPHPSAQDALEYVRDQVAMEPGLFAALASCGVEGNRLAEVCGETLSRVASGEPVSDRYVLGLAWALRRMQDLTTGTEPSKTA